MERLNYYQVHKNKKPKRLKSKKVNLLSLKLAVLAMESFAHHAMICSKQFNSVTNKSLAIVQNTINIANAAAKLAIAEKKNRYLKTSRI
jgi:hypothetical protein